MPSVIYSGKYQVQELIAQGGMGTVYKALDIKLNRVVALKVVHPHLSSDSSFLDRFLREARDIARLPHENIVSIFSVEQDQSTPFLVMEYFPSTNLREIIQASSGAPVWRAVTIIRQIAKALAYAHSYGIIHRDVKPGNVLVGNDNRAKLTDFALAAALGQRGLAPLTSTGQIIGSLFYMAPEQARDDLLDGRSDLYSLGMTFYELLTGVNPRRNLSSTAILRMLLSEGNEAVPDFPPSVPAEIQHVVKGLLRFRPTDRIQDADSLLTQLENLRPIWDEHGAIGSDEPYHYSIPLTPARQSVLEGDIPHRLISKQFYLCVVGDLTEEELRYLLPSRLRIGAPKELEVIVTTGLPGVRLSGVSRVDSPIVRTGAGFHYFQLEQKGPVWESICRAHSIAVHIPESLKHLQIEIFTLSTEEPTRATGCGLTVSASPAAANETCNIPLPTAKPKKQKSWWPPNWRISGWISSKKKITAEIPLVITDEVHVSATAPRMSRPGTSFMLDVWAYLEKNRLDVVARAKESQGGRDIWIRSKGPVMIERNAIMAVRLDIPRLGIKSMEDTIWWTGSIGNCSFPVKIPNALKGGICPGVIHIFVGELQVAKLHFEFEVGDEQKPITDITTELRKIKSAFASYASEDRDEVLGRIQGMRKLLPNLDLFLDVSSLRSGERWEERLTEEIGRRDIFYLFWSLAASRSPSVEKEWRTALRTKGLEYIDPVPLEPPSKVPPPVELASLHFNEWTLAFKSDWNMSHHLE
jgi:serine/threonine protein kinase